VQSSLLKDLAYIAILSKIRGRPQPPHHFVYFEHLISDQLHKSSHCGKHVLIRFFLICDFARISRET
jgi:hypothetical protein